MKCSYLSFSQPQLLQYPLIQEGHRRPFLFLLQGHLTDPTRLVGIFGPFVLLFGSRCAHQVDVSFLDYLQFHLGSSNCFCRKSRGSHRYLMLSRQSYCFFSYASDDSTFHWVKLRYLCCFTTCCAFITAFLCRIAMYSFPSVFQHISVY